MPRASSIPEWFSGTRERASKDGWEVLLDSQELFLTGNAVYPRDEIKIEIIPPKRSTRSRSGDPHEFYQFKVTPPETWWAPQLGSVADSSVIGAARAPRPDGLKPQKFPEWERDGIGYVDRKDEESNDGLRQEQHNQMFTAQEWKIFGPGLYELHKEWLTPIEEMGPVGQGRWERVRALRDLGQRHHEGDLNESEYELAKEALAEEHT